MEEQERGSTLQTDTIAGGEITIIETKKLTGGRSIK